MLDQLINGVYSFIASRGIDKINELEKQYNNQRILLMTISQLADGDYFRNEFKNVIYIENEEIILSISPELISPILGLSDLVENLHPMLEQIFICSDSIEQKHLFKSVVLQYISKSKLTVSLLELSKQQRLDTENIIENVHDLKQELNVISKSLEIHNIKKARALKSGLGRKINSFIYEAANFYILITTKKAPEYNLGTEKEIIVHYMNTIQHLIEIDFPEIDEKFYTKPIETFTVDKEELFKTHSIKLDVYKTLFLYKKKLLQMEDDLLKYSNIIPEDFFIAMMELIGFMDQNPNFMLYGSGMSEQLKNLKPANGFDMARTTKDEYKHLGNLILALKPYIF